MSELPFPLAGVTLLVGVTNVGKTWLTARALDVWVRRYGPGGVVVWDFAPEVWRGDRLIGGRLGRGRELPEGIWLGVIEAHAPRASSRIPEEAVALAEENAERAARLMAESPADPLAVFVNDVTIACQHPRLAAADIVSYCRRARVAVLNAFAGTELGTEDPVSRQERVALDVLIHGADRVVPLPLAPAASAGSPSP